ncbi:MAG: hypothetical protein ACE5FJ_12215, partial [Gemmatimonadales bacterium]
LAGVAVDPTGSYVAYLTDAARAISVQNLDGGAAREIFSHPDNQPLDERALFWSADGLQVHFVTVLEGVAGLFAVSAEGGEPDLVMDFDPFLGQLLTVHGVTGRGNYIISANSQIYVGADPSSLTFTEGIAATAGAIVETEQAIVISASVSPDETWVAYGALGEEISDVATGVARLDGTANVVLSTDNRELGVEWSRWRPEGDAVYFLRRTHGGRGDIVAVDIDPRTGARRGHALLVYPQLALRGLPDISADGLTLVYGGGIQWSSFFLIDPGGEAEAISLFADGTSYNHTPAFTPDGDELVFLRSAAAGLGYRVIRREVGDGTEHIITEREASGVACGARVSPDGATYALVDIGYAGRSSLVLIDLASGDVRELPLPRGGCTPDFAPDGSRIAVLPYVGSEEVVTIVDTETGEAVDVMLRCDTGCGFAGEQIAISSAWPLAAATSDDDLWIADLTDGSIIPLVHGIHHVFLWAADGSIYFTREPSDRDNSNRYGLFKVSAGGGDPELVVDVPEECSPFGLALAADLSRMVCTTLEQRP